MWRPAGSVARSNSRASKANLCGRKCLSQHTDSNDQPGHNAGKPPQRGTIPQ